MPDILPEIIAASRRHPWWRRAMGLAAALLILAYFGFALIFLSLRYAVLPHIEDYRGSIERVLSGAIGLPVSIASIDGQWQGLRPHLALHGFAVRDRAGRPALTLDKVEADVSWTSLLYFGLRLRRLEIISPSLTVRRDRSGQIFVAGLALSSLRQGGDFSAWLLAQHRVVVRDATITWQDEQRAAPPLQLDHLNFNLQNSGSRHRFGLTADPPKNLATKIDVRGDFRGDRLDRPDTWRGQAYAELDYADLAVWRRWVDYPLELPRGSGGMRLWLGFAQRQVTSFTADIALADVALRLAPDLPLLDLQSVSGRLAGTRLPNGFIASAKHLALTTADGIKVEPSDFRLSWSAAQGAAPAQGELSADGLDLGALARLAAFLPLDDAARKRLAGFAPHGRVFGLKASWSGSAEKLLAYRLRARFQGLGMSAVGPLPGFDGLSGSVDASERGGSFKIASRGAAIDLPAVFADPHLDLQSLNARGGWAAVKAGVEVKVDSLAFENKDAAGVASGSYLARPNDPGVIDMSARLTRADAGAVWRYMPLVVNKGVRDWLHSAIVGGKSDGTTLRLKGDLTRFPFADGSGLFEVKGQFHGATLRYAPSWPAINDIDGTLAFTGKGMTITASRGSIYGVTVNGVSARIDDLAAPEGLLEVTGKASGPTADFLRFIEASPVGERIDHFTAGMSASGKGELALKLALPLAHVAATKIDGDYQFDNNRLVPGTGLPPLTELAGRLRFSGTRLSADRVRAKLFDMPLSLDVKTAGNGTVLLSADGGVNIATLRRQYDQPLLDRLSGSTTWHGSAQLRKKAIDLVIESRLQGIASSLPEPFNKRPAEILPLRFSRQISAAPPVPPTASRKTAAAATPRDQFDLALGKILAARVFYRRDGQGVARGAISIGEPLVLPDKGLLLSVKQKKIDADFWRSLLSKAKGGGVLPLTTVKLQAQQMTIFGRAVNDLALTATPRDGGWHAEVNSRELSGGLDWRGAGAGRLSGHLKRLEINETAASPSTSGAEPQELPGLDLEADQFLFRGRALGKLKINAVNRKGVWEAKLGISNEDGSLSGEGTWRAAAVQPDTHLKFTVDAKNIEKTLSRVGYPDVVRRGRATLDGTVTWSGSPLAIDYPSLDGSLSVVATGGQFNKLEPGAGRLLGILSLQSLPRRITLNFRDIFSEGFAFDSIAGQLGIKRGVMSSGDLRIQGPSAKILMSGSVDLSHETQDLKVLVQPAIGESLSVGAILMAHPAVGAIAYLVQKLLRDPIDQAFAYEYSVTGTWADPKVEKLSAPQAPESGRTSP